MLTGHLFYHAARLVVVASNSSAESDIPRSTHARSSGRCQEPGILRRTRHLRICTTEAPSALAAPEIAGQRVGENMSMPEHRDIVSPLSRPSVPLRDKTGLRSWAMADAKARSIYRAQLKARMTAARKATGMSQPAMGLALKVGGEAYKKMEQRGALPTDLVESFAALCKTDPCYILTGRHIRAAEAAPAIQVEPRQRRIR